MLRILYFTKSKPYTLKFLKKVLKDGHTVTVVAKNLESFSGSEMNKFCTKNGVEIKYNHEIYNQQFLDKIDTYDIGISNTYGRLIKKEIIDGLKGRIFNIHCAPLPKYKGMFAYNWGIYNGETQWAVTAHYVDEDFDTGEIIKTKEFDINPNEITVKELEEQSQINGYELSIEVMNLFKDSEMPKGNEQSGETHYYSRDDFEGLKRIYVDMDEEEILRRVRACHCPPYEGAYLMCKGEKILLSTGIL